MIKTERTFKPYVRERKPSSFVSTAEMMEKFNRNIKAFSLPHATSKCKLTLTSPKGPELKTSQRVPSLKIKSTSSVALTEVSCQASKSSDSTATNCPSEMKPQAEVVSSKKQSEEATPTETATNYPSEMKPQAEVVSSKKQKAKSKKQKAEVRSIAEAS
ncbi:hypothetical protein LWI29_028512 [Acer saccharum]|uniref:Uncharacterized protein n=1 Tax=Acer saccharum TaxID=4024 RepID=A0AA39VYE5_ACESA|nr:hypothetical protein LWI29_028512 [Acer saccharum]